MELIKKWQVWKQILECTELRLNIIEVSNMFEHDSNDFSAEKHSCFCSQLDFIHHFKPIQRTVR